MPSDIEDKLIIEYQKNYPGTVYKEIPVGEIENKNRQRRIDAILIENKENKIYEWGEYDIDDVEKEIEGEKIHLIEAKKKLGRAVIGQVEVGEFLVEADFDPDEIVLVALCSKNHSDLEKYCNNKNINVEIYNINYNNIENNSERLVKGNCEIKDIRNKPDSQRYIAFKAGWNEAVNGKLYNSIQKRKTHMNMGNLFGWIYGKCTEEMKKNIWKDYIDYNKEYLNKDW